MRDDLDQLVDQFRRRVGAIGYELADLRVGGARARPRIQVRIDLPESRPGHGVTVDDCATVSRALEDWLDGTQLFGSRYILEVSSPGIERSIRWREHWERFVGHDVRVKLPDRGRIRATIVEVVKGGTAVVLRPQRTTETIIVALSEAADARLTVDWESPGSSGAQPDQKETE